MFIYLVKGTGFISIVISEHPNVDDAKKDHENRDMIPGNEWHLLGPFDQDRQDFGAFDIHPHL